MTQEEKELLLIDLCGRLSYGVICEIYNSTCTIKEKLLFGGISHFADDTIGVRPFLRSMSSMTEDEREEYGKLGGVMSYNSEHNTWAMCAFTPEAYDWLNKKMFDYRGLIPMGLALEASENMYKNNTKIK